MGEQFWRRFGDALLARVRAFTEVWSLASSDRMRSKSAAVGRRDSVEVMAVTDSGCLTGGGGVG